MATQINNYQLAKLIDANKVLGGAIDITGSADEMSSGLADGDFFLVQDASSGVPQKIQASVMQDYFSLQDVTVASSGTGYRLLFIDSSGEDREVVYVDDATLTFDADNQQLVIHSVQIAGTADLNGSLDFDGSSFDVDASSYFQVDASAASHIKTNSGALALSGAAGVTASSALSVSGAAGFDSTLTVTGAAHLKSTLRVDSSIDANSTADISDTLTLSKGSGFGLVVSADADINGGLDVEGASDIADTLTLSKGSGNGLVVSAGAQVAGLLDLNGSVDADVSTFDVDASSYFQVDAAAASHIKTSSGALALSGAAGVTASSALSVSGAAGFDSTLNVTGAAHLKSTLRVDSDIDANGGIDVAGAVSLGASGGSADTTVRGDLAVDENVTITGNLTVNGAATTVDTTNVLVADPLMVLAKNQTSDATLDVGFIVQRSGSNQGFIWDETEDEFAMIVTTEDGSTAGNVTIASYAGARLGALRADGAIDANSTSDFADTATFSKGSGTGLAVTSNATIGGDIVVTGLADLNGSLDFDGSTFDVDASSYFQVDAQAASHIKTNSGALALSGAAGVTASSALSVSGAAGFDSTLTVTGAIHAKSTLRVDSSIDANSTADISDTLTLSKGSGTGLSVTADATIGGALTMDGTSAGTAALSDVFYFQGASNEVKKETISEVIDLAKSDGIQISSGLVSIDYVEQLFMSSSLTSGISASLSQEPLADSLHVYLNGLLVLKSGSIAGNTSYDYKIDGSGASQIVVFPTDKVTLDSDDVVTLKYIKK